MKKLIFTFWLISFPLFSQRIGIQRTNGIFNNNLEHFALAKIKTKTNNEVSSKNLGRYYVKSTWTKCTIQGVDEKIHHFKSCNYNVFDKRMELLFDDEIVILDSNSFTKIKLEKDVFKPFKFDSTNDNNYFQELFSDENISLIKLYRLKKKSIPSTQSLGMFKQKVKVMSENYFVIKGKIIKVPRSMKKILKILNKQNLKGNFKGLNPRKDSDLIKIVKA